MIGVVVMSLVMISKGDDELQKAERSLKRLGRALH
jgi:hypothetical protein